ncbi:MAG: hypothetical protein HY953_08860 [Candidatus Rokubacteria bacterium]|nr:hypothetical protein [Candidatus Rokubacteria bacterium]
MTVIVREPGQRLRNRGLWGPDDEPGRRHYPSVAIPFDPASPPLPITGSVGSPIHPLAIE